jgi:hypothetical protein
MGREALGLVGLVCFGLFARLFGMVWFVACLFVCLFGLVWFGLVCCLFV